MSTQHEVAAVRVAPERRAVMLPRGPADASMRAAAGGRPAAGTPPARIRAAIVGATGYVGAELVRLLTRHPNVEIVGLVGRGRTHEPIGGTHIHLDRTGLHVDAVVPDADAVFLALPHGAAAEIVPDIAATGAAIIDLGPDFRLRAAADYPRWYGFEHPRPELLDGAVYGLPELHRDALGGLRDAAIAIVGAPGCYPTATLLALEPLAVAGLLSGDVIVDAKSGVSGAGKSPSERTHFSENHGSVAAYGLFGHRHTPEMEQALGLPVTFTPHLVPLDRGILATIYARLVPGTTAAQVSDALTAAYADAFFVRLTGDRLPEIKHVAHTNFCDIGWRVDEATGRLIVVSVIDNLVKGAAGQAVQNMNLMFGFPEGQALDQLAVVP